MNKYKKRLFFIAYLLLIFLNIAFSQDTTVLDSFRNRLSNSQITLKDSIETQVQIANYFVYHNLDSAAYYIDKVLEYPNLSKVLSKGYYKHYIVKAWVHHGKMEMDTAKHYYLKTQSIVDKGRDRKAKIEIAINIAAFLEQTRDEDAMSFINNYLARIDTSMTRDDKIAWILGLRKSTTLN